MKTFIISLMTLVSASTAIACSCSEYTLNPRESIKEVIEQRIGHGYKLDKSIKLDMVKAYPTLAERTNLYGFKGTSCEVFGPQDESLFYCSGRIKADYEVVVKNCVYTVQAKSTYTKVKAKIKNVECN